MSTKKKHIVGILYCLMVACAVKLSAQDAHLSQAFNHMAFLNTGILGEHKIYINSTYRQQWRSVTTPYTTKALTIEKGGEKLGAGGYFMENDAGKASIRQLSFGMMLKYRARITYADDLNFGMQLGMYQKGFDPRQFQFEDQHLMQSDISQERFPFTQFIQPDFSMGLNWRHYTKFTTFHLGGQLNHMIQSNGLDETEEVPLLSKKLTLHADYAHALQVKLGVRAFFYTSFQNKAREFYGGAQLKRRFSEEKHVLVGVGMRWKDAIVPYLGYQSKKLLWGVTYDVNYSKLKMVSQGRGAFELHLGLRLGGILKPAEPMAFAQDEQAPVEVFESDKDQDGIPDKKDHCPYIRGVEELHGCPCLDRDGDGVFDRSDKCPDQHGIVELEGCPVDTSGVEQGDQPLRHLLNKKNKKRNDPSKKKGKQASVVEDVPLNIEATKYEQVLRYTPVYFDVDKSIIKPKYQRDLDVFVEVARQTQYATILIAGHTDADGSSAYNLGLGDSRAQAVRLYLLQSGISLDKMETISYGEQSPAATNASKEGKSKNRRVELYLVH